MKIRAILAALAWVVVATSIATSATIHVPLDQPTIQAGINVSSDGDAVRVAPGTYLENITFSGKRIAVASEAGPASTIIQAANSGNPTVSFTANEPKGALLEGFTITGSNNSGIVASGSSPTIRRNIITGNRSNSGDNGAGINFINTRGAIVVYNEFHHNTADTYGRSVHIKGGQDDTVAYNLMRDNSGYQEIRCFTSRTVLLNNTLVGPGSGWGIQCLVGGYVTAINNIVAGQYGAQYSCYGPDDTLRVSFGCVWDCTIDYQGDGIFLGPGNIKADPLFLGATKEDYHLTNSSPCIDAGDSLLPPDPDGTRSDMGAFAFTQSRVDSIEFDGSLDLSHIVSHQPTIQWTYIYFVGGSQDSLQVEIGTDSVWSNGAEMWTLLAGDSSSSVVYGGTTLTDGLDYWLRIRAATDSVWTGWTQRLFHMNSAPSVPEQILPVNFHAVAVNPPTFRASTGADAEGDQQQLRFAIITDDSIVVDESPWLPPTPVPSDDTVTWTGSVPLLENGSFIWAVKSWDGLEETSYGSAWRVFYVNAIEEPPTAPGRLSPAGDSISYTLYPVFGWTHSDDPDPFDSVGYDYQVSLNSIFSGALEVPDLSDTMLTLFTPLEIATRYWWRVLSHDRQGHETTSLASQFRVYQPGDANGSWNLSGADIITLVNYVFKGQALTVPECAGRCNGDGTVSSNDIIWLVNAVFKGGPEPQAGCVP
jgi:hypothetical protein